ncbi:ATPase, T2SS/T4P/T4SS family [Culicoidibacter larvae]|nr:ATPase, T2SS/T4P/T4SS family [Culicoidibacter larvae]
MEVKIYFECLLKHLLDNRIADVHFIIDANGSRVMVRSSNKKMIMIAELIVKDMRKLMSFIKYIASMSLANAIMESGVLHYHLNEQLIDLRVAVMPMADAELMTLRIHYQNSNDDFDYLTDNQSHQKFFQELCHQEQGLVVFSGATGNGKTTTIYTLMNYMLKLGKHIVSIEDPIEQKINGVMQFEVNELAGRSYDAMLSQVLRHDPDVIVIGEVRNSSVAKSALRAALTGHLVITTIHAQSCQKVVQRLLDLKCNQEMIMATMIASVYQQLHIDNKTNDKYCQFTILDTKQIQKYLSCGRQSNDFLQNGVMYEH